MTNFNSILRTVLVFILLCLMSNPSNAQSVDYQKAMEDIMDNLLDDYPEPAIKALDELFSGVKIDDLPAETRFFYYAYYGQCFNNKNRDKAIDCFINAYRISHSELKLIRNEPALGVMLSLADLWMASESEEYQAAALLMYNEIITIGISLIKDTGIGGLVVMSLIEEAKMGVKIWLDEDWVRKMWIQARDLAIEIDDATYYSYYVLSVLKYYCDLGDYDTSLSFMEDAVNKEILKVDVSSYCEYIKKTKMLLAQNESIIKGKGATSLDYWANRLEIASYSPVLNTEEKSIQMLQDVELGLEKNNLTESYEYAQVLYLLAAGTSKHLELSEQYFIKQVTLLNAHPNYFIYTTDVEVYNALGVCQMKLGRYSQAQENYQKAMSCLERDKEYSDTPGYKQILFTVLHNLGRNHYFLGNKREAVEYLTRSIKIQEEANGIIMPKTKVYLSEALGQLIENN